MTKENEIKILRGVVTNAKQTEDFFIDEDGREWRKCLFSVRLSSFSKRMKNRKLPKELDGEVVNLVRYCTLDWHLRVGRFITLTPEETITVLGKSQLLQQGC